MVLSRSETTRRLILVATITAAITACSSGPKGASKTFYSALGNGNTDKAMKMLDMTDIPPQAQLLNINAKIRSSMASFHQKAVAHGGLEGVKILSVQRIDATHTKVTADLKFRDGSNEKVEDLWVKIKGKWLLDVAND